MRTACRLHVSAIQRALSSSSRNSKAIVASHWCCALEAGGANRDRTGDLLLAKQALSQLSYGPVLSIGGSGRSCTSDLTLIRGAL